MALYAFDGTWNDDEEGDGRDTNVAKFCSAYGGPNKFYLEGVGTRASFIGKLLGGVAGVGGRIRTLEATQALKKNFRRGDRTIDIVGFSRGAALALNFANEVDEEMDGAQVRFLGLWDTVASFGLPGNDLNLAWHLTLPANVAKCYHAMALDERRGNFAPTRVKGARAGHAADGRLEEVWFRGVHSDVGGGASVGLSSIALCWMLRRALANGLPMDDAGCRRFEALRNPDAPISRTFDPKLDPARRIEPTDIVHASVRPRGRFGGVEHNDPPATLRVIE
jgi:uncharacterized protein (DUF2235 family)